MISKECSVESAIMLTMCRTTFSRVETLTQQVRLSQVINTATVGLDTSTMALVSPIQVIQITRISSCLRTSHRVTRLLSQPMPSPMSSLSRILCRRAIRLEKLPLATIPLFRKISILLKRLWVTKRTRFRTQVVSNRKKSLRGTSI